MRRALTACEREFIIGATDADPSVRIYVDAHHRLFRPLVAVACAWDVEPRRMGSGVEFDLPWRALRFAKPSSEKRRQASRASLKKARFASRNALRKGAAEGVASSARGETPALRDSDAPEPFGEEDRP